MTTHFDEKISAFIDGEAGRSEVLDILQQARQAPELRAMILRQHRLRAALQGQLHPGPDAGFADRVMAGIAAAETRGEALETVRLTRWRPAMRSLAGLAVAASVTAVAVFALQTLPTGFTPLITTASHDQAAAQLAAGIEPVREVQWEQLPADAADQLNDYLISHSNYAADHGLGGTLGFARMTSQDVGLQTDSGR